MTPLLLVAVIVPVDSFPANQQVQLEIQQDKNPTSVISVLTYVFFLLPEDGMQEQYYCNQIHGHMYPCVYCKLLLHSPSELSGPGA